MGAGLSLIDHELHLRMTLQTARSEKLLHVCGHVNIVKSQERDEQRTAPNTEDTDEQPEHTIAPDPVYTRLEHDLEYHPATIRVLAPSVLVP